MEVDCVDATECPSDFFDSDALIKSSPSSLWFGREVSLSIERNYKIELLAKSFFSQLHQIEAILNIGCKQHRYHLLDLDEEIAEEISSNLDKYAEYTYLTALHHPSNQDFALLDPKNYQADIAECKNLLKSVCKTIKKAGKKIAKKVEKVAKDVADFVKEHPKEIALGALAVGVGIGAFYLFGGLAQAAAGAAAAGLGAEETSGRRREEDNETETNPEPIDTASPPPPSASDPFAKQENFSPLTPADIPLPPASSPSCPSILDIITPQERARIENNPLAEFTKPPQSIAPFELQIPKLFQSEKKIQETPLLAFPNPFKPNFFSSESAKILEEFANLEKNTPQRDLSQTSSFQNIISSILKNTIAEAGKIEPGFSEPLGNLKMLEPSLPIRSCYIEIDGIRYRDTRIGFVNGMATSYEEMQQHMEYLQKLTNGMAIEGVYNRSNTAIVDLMEIFFFSYSGFAPITANLLIENWTRFHEENKDNPNAKYWQCAHSMGTIITKIALEKAPKEIRDRVMVLSIAPAVVIPDDLCHSVVSFASEKDRVHLGQNLSTLFASTALEETERFELLENLQKSKSQLILLEPPLGYEDGWDHDFESPTFEERIKDHTNDYIKNNNCQ